MLLVKREKILTHLQEVPQLVDKYQAKDLSFIADVLQWLANTEQSLQQVRSPLSSLVASERAKILAVADGYRDIERIDARSRTRKAESATASIALGNVELHLRNAVSEIDTRFDSWREKMAQLIAISHAAKPLKPPLQESRTEWIKGLWLQLHITPETKSMYSYLNAAIANIDRLYLLEEVIDNITNNETGIEIYSNKKKITAV